ncbi:MAG: hypothetical protein M3Z85_02500 [Acidobacteriota bacterium]|nr:hypothetical protein [Acidobacteriota bacterium]
MDGDRKYQHRGYMNGDDRPKQQPHQGPRPPLDITGPRLPRLVQAVTASRCFNCSTQLPAGSDFPAICPKCHAELHCCKQCGHFEPSTRFQCVKPIPVRIPVKDKANTCALFSPRVTVARDASGIVQQKLPVADANSSGPRNASDARSAFDRLFKKPEE